MSTDKPNDKKGFAGFDSLISDVDQDIAAAKTESKAESTNSVPPPRPTPAPQPAPAPGPAPMPQSNPLGQVPKAVWWWGAIILGIILLNLDDGPKKPKTVGTTKSSPSTSWRGNDESSWTEQRPAVGTDNLLNYPQIRYCVAEDIRISTMQPLVDRYSDAEIDAFNATIGDYNSRCAKFRYRSGSLESIRREAEGRRGEFESQGRERVLGWRRQSNAPPASAPLVASKPKPSSAQAQARAPKRAAAPPVITLEKALNSPRYAAPRSAKANANFQTCITGKYPSLCDHSDLTAEERGQVAAAERAENLKTCLTGKYPSLCNHSLLTGDEAARVASAERAENYKTCATGKYPSLCKHELLESSEQGSVIAAEHDENYRTCISGKYPSLCKHELLTAQEAAAVQEAELEENLRTCLSGRYPSLCKHHLLTSEQSAQVAAAEARER